MARPKVIYFLPAFIWFSFITVLLVLPGPDIPTGPLFNIPFFDKYVHIFMFALLSFLSGVPFLKTQMVSIKLFFFISFGYLLYGIMMEFVQKYWVVGRNFDVMDMVADGIGSFVGYSFLVLMYRKKIKTQAS